MLADLLTVRESLGGWDGKTVAWIGDGNNMANSWINAAGSLGFELRLACPEGYRPDAAILERNQGKATIVLTADPREAARGAHVVTTDVWASMGQEEEQEIRAKAFQGYIVDGALMRLADPSAIFLHCLPAHRGEEVSEDVLEGPQSRVWDEAENRLHVQKALMATLDGRPGVTATPTLQRTALYDRHKALGAKMVPFAGWEMPVQYPTGILAEHHAVRSGVGIFDVSHMGEFEITGPDRNAFVNRVTTNDVSPARAGPGAVLGAAHARGHLRRRLHGLPLRRQADDRGERVEHGAGVGAHRRPEGRHQRPAQGHLRRGRPHRRAGAARRADPPAARRHRRSARSPTTTHGAGKIAGAQCFISRTGYTGEDGFELYCRERDTVALWDAITAAGAQPIGLGARDSLRLEMGYALYGNEIDDTITPLEAGLGWIVKLDKGSRFTGDQALRSQKQRGVTRRLVGFRLEGRGFPRRGFPTHHEGREADIVRSGTLSPSLGVGDRHDLPARRDRQAGREVRGRVPRRAAPGRGRRSCRSGPRAA